MEFSLLVAGYFKKCGVSIPDVFLVDKIKTHPDYPSLNSLTETLDEYGIEYEAVKIDKNEIPEIDSPFLIHVIFSSGGSDFLIFESSAQLQEQNESVLRSWDGIIFMIDPSADITDESIINYKRTKRKKNLFTIISFCAILLFLSLSFLEIGNRYFLCYFLLNIIGLLVSVLINMQSLGRSNKLLEQLCGGDDDKSCDSVINSEGSKFLRFISLGELCFWYFSTTLLFLFIGNVSKSNVTFFALLFILSLLSLPVSIFSIYYQSIVLKKWCKLCMLIICTLWLQCLSLAVFYLPVPSWTNFIKGVISLDTINPILFICFIILVLLHLIRPLIYAKDDLRTTEISLNRFKRNPNFFLTSLYNNKRAEISFWDEDISLGNPQANTVITVACNPYCAPCAKSHKVIEQILKKYPKDIRIVIRFLLSTKDTSHRKVIAANFLISKYKKSSTKEQGEVIETWFKYLDVDKWVEYWKLDIDMFEEHYELLDRHSDWCRLNKIHSTPTVFINGYAYPMSYSFEDLLGFLPSIIENRNRNSVSDFETSSAG